MYLLLILACLLLATAGWMLRRRFASAGSAMIAIGALGCVGLGVWQIFGSWSGFGAPATHRGQAALGYIMAQHVLSDTRQKQGTIALLLPPDQVASTVALDSFYRAFARVLLPFQQLKVAEVSYNTSAKEWRAGNTPLAAIETATQSAPDAIAFVVYGGLPHGGEKLSILNQQPKPLLYVYDPSGSKTSRTQLESGTIKLSVVPKNDSKPNKNTPTIGSPNEIFDRHFKSTTVNSLGSK